MEFTNEIFFNKKLIQDESVLITYSGKLFKEYSSEITIVYGFGSNWDYTQETKMQEKENGFEALITLKNYDTFNFCFKNNYNIWDNNSGFNYIASIEPASSKEEVTENQTILDSDESKIESEIIEETTNITEENKNENTEESSQNSTESDLNKSFSDLLESILQTDQTDTTKDVHLEKGFGLQSIDEVKETDFTSCDKIFQELYNELSEIPSDKNSNKQTISESNIETNETTSTLSSDSNSSSSETEETLDSSNSSDTKNSSKLESLLNDLSESKEEESKDESSVSSEELNDLMDNILNSIIESESTEKDSKSELPVVQSQAEEFIDKCIDGTFNFFRSAWNGCKKIGQLIKKKAKQLLSEE